MIFASDGLGVGAGWGFFWSVLLNVLRCFAAELITGGEFIAGVAQW